MGTSGSYSGSGGRPGRDIRTEIGRWLDGLPPNGPPDNQPPARPQLQPATRVARRAIGLFEPRSDSGNGGGGGGAAVGTRGGGRRAGGVQRSVARAARSAGRAAAGAYAYGTANREVLSALGLDYDELRGLGDPLEVSRRIVEAACGPRSESTIDHEEQRWVAAKIAEWVFEEQEAGALPQPDDIARKAIAFIIFEAIASEAGELMNGHNRPEWTIDWSDGELRDAAEVLSREAQLSVDGVTNAEFTKAIEDGIETLRRIYRVRR